MVGILPHHFLDNTWKENSLLSESYENKQLDEWDRIRHLMMAIYQSEITMNGKQAFKSIKKPKDIMPLPQDKIIRTPEVSIDLERASLAKSRLDKYRSKYGIQPRPKGQRNS